MFAVFRLAGRLLAGSFVLWVVLSTAVPQLSQKLSDPQIQQRQFTSAAYPYQSLTSPAPCPISNSSVYFVIGHPDDEVMFFSPSVVELAKPKHGNRVQLVCFSRGDAEDASMGAIRAHELRSSARILGVAPDHVHVLDSFQDGMDVEWRPQDVAGALARLVQPGTPAAPTVVVTFDEHGVSRHPNHIALYHGCRRYMETFVKQPRTVRLFVLKSLNFWEKYSFTVLTNVELLVDLVSRFVLRNVLNINVNISFFNSHHEKFSVRFYSDLNMLSVSYAAMAYGHFSQMVWFRYGWLVFSRYLNFNQLVQIY